VSTLGPASQGSGQPGGRGPARDEPAPTEPGRPGRFAGGRAPDEVGQDDVVTGTPPPASTRVTRSGPVERWFFPRGRAHHPNDSDPAGDLLDRLTHAGRFVIPTLKVPAAFAPGRSGAEGGNQDLLDHPDLGPYLDPQTRQIMTASPPPPPPEAPRTSPRPASTSPGCSASPSASTRPACRCSPAPTPSRCSGKG